MSETTTPADSGGDTTESPNHDGSMQGLLESEGILGPDDAAKETPDVDTGDDGDDDSDEELFRLKVNGRTISKTRTEVIKAAQLYEATQTKLETAKKEIESARETKQALETQQAAVRNLLGVMARGDIETIAEFVSEKLNAGEAFNKAVIKYAIGLYEQSKMSPEQREAIENKKLVTKLRQEAEERGKAEQERAFQYEVNRMSQHIEVEVPKAITAVGLPNSAFVRDHVISTWRAALERGQTPTAMAVANFVKEKLSEAKMLGNPVPKPTAPVRPKATRESAGVKKSSNGVDGSQYQGWEEWKRTRGH